MTFIPQTGSEQEQTKQGIFNPGPPTSEWQNIQLHAYNSLISGIGDIGTVLLGDIGSSNFVTKDAWGTITGSLLNRPTLSKEEFEKNPEWQHVKWHKGITKWEAEYKANQIIADELNQNLLDHLPQSRLNTPIGWAGDIIGMGLNPLSHLTVRGIKATVGKFGAGLVEGLAKKGVSKFALRAAKVTKGAMEGAFFMSPFVAGEAVRLKYIYGKDMEPGDALEQLGVGAAFNGIMPFIVDYRPAAEGKPSQIDIDTNSLISNEAHKTALQTAVGQLSAGKRVRVEPIIQQALYEKSLERPPLAMEELQSAHDDVTRSIPNLEETLSPYVKKGEFPITGQALIDLTSQIRKLLPETRTKLDNQLLDYLGDKPELRLLEDLQNTPANFLTVHDQDLLRRFNKQDENTILSDRLDFIKREEKRLEDELEQVRYSYKEGYKTEKVINEIKNAQERIKKFKKETEKRIKYVKSLAKNKFKKTFYNLYRQKLLMQSLKESTDAQMKLASSPITAPHVEDIKQLAEHMKSVESDFIYDPEAEKLITETANQEDIDFESELKDLDKEYEEGIKNNYFDKEDQELFEKLSEDDSPKIKALLDAYKKCVLKGGE